MRRSTIASALLLTAFASHAFSEVTLPPLERTDLTPKLAARVWIEEMNCVACHASPTEDLSTSSRKAPRLATVAQRIQPHYLTAFLTNPPAVKPGTMMPNILADLPDAEREAAARSITHFLISLDQGNRPFTLQPPDSVAAERGEKLFHSVGCVACHSPRDAAGQETLPQTSVPLGHLDGKYSLHSLTEFLRHPHEARPSLRMPAMGLPDADLERIAQYLLRQQKVPGHLTYTLWRGKVAEGLDGDVEKERGGLVDDFSLERLFDGRVPHNVAIRYEGYLKIDRAGDYTFYLEMNGGKLLLNGAEVASEPPSNHRGTKSLRQKASLKEGWNRLELTYFHTGFEPKFRFEMEGPAVPRGPIPAEKLSISDQPIAKFEPLKPDPALVEKGRTLVAQFNCARCHDDLQKFTPPSRNTYPALANLDPAKGCLADAPAKNIPHFDLSADTKKLIRAALPALEKEKLSDAEQINQTLVSLNCLACHERKGLGGPDPARDIYFTGTREALGNQGRIPPPLTDVGAKLTLDWMTNVLLHGGRQRPYLNTRMPQFGEANVAHLVELFGKVDKLEETALPKVADIQESKQAGYGMIGADGFSCIACHDFNGQRSGGAGALDLVGVTQRLKKNWFHLYMREPYRFHPTGIMPTYWPGGLALRKEVLGGDTAQQIEALWNYLADGDRVKAPKGLSRQSKELRVTDETIICRGRGTVAGFRALGVGYPERISLVFDTEQMSLRLLWRGEFVDADIGSFHVRSRDPIELPPGIPFHRLASLDAAWPYKGKTDYTFPQDHGYQFLGYRLDKARRPIFQYRYGEIAVEDFFEDRLDAAGTAFFRRTLKLSTSSAQPPFYFRAAAGPTVTGAGHEWKAGKLAVRLLGDLQGKVRPGDPAELLVPLELRAGETVIQLEYQW